MFTPVILSGGEGARLWPLSQPAYPKQFLSLCSENSLFQDTLHRLDHMNDAAPPIILCHEDHRFIVAENVRSWGKSVSRILLEPVRKNTAPAIAAACWYALEHEKDPVLVVFPADHVMEQSDTLYRAIQKAVRFAEQGKLVTFGITPTCPHTGYGYIKTSIDLEDEVKVIDAFTEKPNEETARQFVDQEGYLWNSGIFCFKASAYLDQLKLFNSQIFKNSKQAFDLGVGEEDFYRLDKNSFVTCDKISIDYAVMEHTSQGVVVPLNMSWSDVGTWSALWETAPKDEMGNILNGEVIAQHSSGNLIQSRHKVVCTIGINDLCIVDTPDTLLVAAKSHIHQVNALVTEMAQAKIDDPKKSDATFVASDKQ